MDPERLVGKDILDLIIEIPQLNWTLKKDSQDRKVNIINLRFVDFDRKKLKDRIDTYTTIGLGERFSGEWPDGVEREDLKEYLNESNARQSGLLSEVVYQKREENDWLWQDDKKDLSKVSEEITSYFEEIESEEEVSQKKIEDMLKPLLEKREKSLIESPGKYRGHIPMLDFDMEKNLDYLDRKEKISYIKRAAMEELGLNQGVILRSSSKENYHLIGIGELLDEDQSHILIGEALKLFYDEDKDLKPVDGRHLGHALSPYKERIELHNENSEEEWSIYDFDQKFATLRVTWKNEGDERPTVVDYFEK